jgi:hypothetical protein
VYPLLVAENDMRAFELTLTDKEMHDLDQMTVPKHTTPKGLHSGVRTSILHHTGTQLAPPEPSTPSRTLTAPGRVEGGFGLLAVALTLAFALVLMVTRRIAARRHAFPLH